MEIIRCQDQGHQTLEEFYTQVGQGDNHVSREGGKAMLGLIARMRALPGGFKVYGLTSHHRLCLLAADTYQSPRFVVVSALDPRNYSVEYLMPAQSAPWPGAYVRGEAHSEDEALEMIVTAMERSEGWAGC